MANVTVSRPPALFEVEKEARNLDDYYDADHLHFRVMNPHNRVRISPVRTKLDKIRRTTYLAVSSRKGWWAAICRDTKVDEEVVNGKKQRVEKEIHFIGLSTLSELQDAFINGSTSSDDLPPQVNHKRIVPIPGPKPPNHVIFAHNDSKMIVCTFKGPIYIYDTVFVFSEGSDMIEARHVLRTESDTVSVREIRANPGRYPQLVAILRATMINSPEREVVQILDLNKGKVVGAWRAAGNSPTNLKAVSWSPSGDMIALGFQSGHIVTYDPFQVRIAKQVWPKPKITPNNSILSADWVTDQTFHAIYCPARQMTSDAVDQDHVITTMNDSLHGADLRLRRPVLNVGERICPFNAILKNWGPDKFIFIIGDGASIDVGLFGCTVDPADPNKEGKWMNWSLEDSSTPGMPTDEDDCDLTPLGFQLDFSFPQPYEWFAGGGERYQLPPPPIMYAFLEDGTMQGWYIVNTRGIVYPEMVHKDLPVQVTAPVPPPPGKGGAQAGPGAMMVNGQLVPGLSPKTMPRGEDKPVVVTPETDLYAAMNKMYKKKDEDKKKEEEKKNRYARGSTPGPESPGAGPSTPTPKSVSREKSATAFSFTPKEPSPSTPSPASGSNKPPPVFGSSSFGNVKPFVSFAQQPPPEASTSASMATDDDHPPSFSPLSTEVALPSQAADMDMDPSDSAPAPQARVFGTSQPHQGPSIWGLSPQQSTTPSGSPEVQRAAPSFGSTGFNNYQPAPGGAFSNLTLYGQQSNTPTQSPNPAPTNAFGGLTPYGGTTSNVFGGPVFGQSAYGQSTSSQPSFGQSAFGQSSFAQVAQSQAGNSSQNTPSPSTPPNAPSTGGGFGAYAWTGTSSFTSALGGGGTPQTSAFGVPQTPNQSKSTFGGYTGSSVFGPRPSAQPLSRTTSVEMTDAPQTPPRSPTQDMPMSDSPERPSALGQSQGSSASSSYASKPAPAQAFGGAFSSQQSSFLNPPKKLEPGFAAFANNNNNSGSSSLSGALGSATPKLGTPAFGAPAFGNPSVFGPAKPAPTFGQSALTPATPQSSNNETTTPSTTPASALAPAPPTGFGAFSKFSSTTSSFGAAAGTSSTGQKGWGNLLKQGDNQQSAGPSQEGNALAPAKEQPTASISAFGPPRAPGQPPLMRTRRQHDPDEEEREYGFTSQFSEDLGNQEPSSTYNDDTDLGDSMGGASLGGPSRATEDDDAEGEPDPDVDGEEYVSGGEEGHEGDGEGEFALSEISSGSEVSLGEEQGEEQGNEEEGEINEEGHEEGEGEERDEQEQSRQDAATVQTPASTPERATSTTPAGTPSQPSSSNQPNIAAPTPAAPSTTTTGFSFGGFGRSASTKPARSSPLAGAALTSPENAPGPSSSAPPSGSKAKPASPKTPFGQLPSGNQPKSAPPGTPSTAASPAPSNASPGPSNAGPSNAGPSNTTPPAAGRTGRPVPPELANAHIPAQRFSEEFRTLMRMTGQEIESLRPLTIEASKRRQALGGGEHAKPGEATLKDVTEFGHELQKTELIVTELRGLEATWKKALYELETVAFKAETKKEEVDRLSKARADPEFAKMLKARTLGPEYVETQTQLRRKIRGAADRIQKLEDVLGATKKKLNELKTGKPTFKAPSLDTINRTYRNIDLAIEQQSSDIDVLTSRVSTLNLDSAPRHREQDQDAKGKRQQQRDVASNISSSTEAVTNAEKKAQKLKKALLNGRNKPIMNTKAVDKEPIRTLKALQEQRNVTTSESGSPIPKSGAKASDTPFSASSSSLPDWSSPLPPFVLPEEDKSPADSSPRLRSKQKSSNRAKRIDHFKPVGTPFREGSSSASITSAPATPSPLASSAPKPTTTPKTPVTPTNFSWGPLAPMPAKPTISADLRPGKGPPPPSYLNSQTPPSTPEKKGEEEKKEGSPQKTWGGPWSPWGSSTPKTQDKGKGKKAPA